MNNERIEQTILRNLIFNEDFTRKVLPFINEIYFPKREEKVLFQEIDNFVQKYNYSIGSPFFNFSSINSTNISPI